MGSQFKRNKRIACLQFAPKLGDLKANISKAESILRAWAPDAIDWLILPEMIFTGYNFPDLASIAPYLEPTTAGPTTKWAIETAKRLNCHVTVGYPEVWYPPTAESAEAPSDPTAEGVKRYNSTVTVSPTGEILLNYRKSYLYTTDETWAHEGPGDAGAPFFHGEIGALGPVSHGICMDINSYRFEPESFAQYKFATAALAAKSPIMALSTAWLTHLTDEELRAAPEMPDLETLFYWIGRFMPVIEVSEKAATQNGAASSEDGEGAQETILVFANRCGSDGDAVFAGSSCVVRIRAGQMEVLDILGRAEEGLLVVDTSQVGKYYLPAQPR